MLKVHLTAIVVFAVLLLAAADGGPDMAMYLDWAGVAAAAGFADANTYTVSPLRIPVLQWGHGTGFVFASGHVVLQALGDTRSSALLIGWLTMLVFWAALLRILWIVSHKSLPLTLFGAGAAFLGTHAGSLSHGHASESIALACIAVLVLLAFDGSARYPTTDFVLAASMVAILITIKSYLAIYALAPLLLMAQREWTRTRSRGRVAALAGVGALPVVLAIAQVGLVNRWMTGSALQSPYMFGDETFRSFDFADPELMATLLHPWHGWWAYHPLNALALLCLVFLAVRSETLEHRVFWSLSGVFVAAHFWLQASWVIWWLGQGTFGSRGMAPSAVVLAAALVGALALLRERSLPAFGLVSAVAMAASVWSFLLLMQGRTSFYDYGSLLAGQLASAWALASSIEGVAVAVGVLIVFGLYRGVWRPPSNGVDWLAGAACLLVGLSLGYLLARVAARPVAESVTLVATGAAVVVVAAMLRVAGTAMFRRFGDLAAAEAPRLVLTVAATMLFVVMTALFVRLAVDVEQRIAARLGPGKVYAFENTFNVRDIRQGCHEYRHADESFLDKRMALRSFLIRESRGAAALIC